MGFDVFVVQDEKLLSRPAGVVKDFCYELAATEANAHGEGNAFLWMNKDEMTEQAKEFAGDWARCEGAKVNPDVAVSVIEENAVKELIDWIGSLPWEDDEITLHFNW